MEPRDDPVDAYVFMHLLQADRTIQEVTQAFRNLPLHEGRRFEKENDPPRRANPFGVRFAHQVVGSSVIFGAVSAPSFERLQSWIANQFWDVGVRSEWSIADRPSRYLAPYRHSPPFYAFIRVRTSGNPRAVLDALDASMDRKILPLLEEYGPDDEYGRGGWRDQFDYRAATVSGKGVDILVELAANSIQELTDTIIDYIGPTEGVESTDTSYSYVKEEDSGQAESS